MELIQSYCSNCHDNTKWRPFSPPLPVKQPNGKTFLFTKYECTICGKRNTFSNYGLTK